VNDRINDKDQQLVITKATVKLRPPQEAKNLFHWAALSVEFRISSMQLNQHVSMKVGHTAVHHVYSYSSYNLNTSIH
jgi:hypothetical protein